MAKSLDRLIAHLLDGIALNSQEGVSRQKLEILVHEYYDQASSRSFQDGPTEDSTSKKSSKPGASVQNGLRAQPIQNNRISLGNRSHPSESKSPRIDEVFLEKVWQWLVASPEIWVKATSVSVEKESSNDHEDTLERTNASSLKSPAPRLGGQEDLQELRPRPQSREELRLYTSQDRRWRALTGHGPDWTRVAKFEFECLAIIAMYGTKGIVQGDLVKQTGQDKRSLPTRTERLHRKGYIVKRLIFKRGSKTSMLYLQKFAPTLSGSSKNHGILDVEAEQKGGLGQAEKDDSVDIGSLLDSLFNILRELSIITYDDLKRKLGVWDKRWHMKILFKVIRRLEIMGCLRRVKAGDESLPNHTFRCVKYIRDPEEKERTLFLDSAAALPDELRASMYGLAAQSYQLNEEESSMNQEDDLDLASSMEDSVLPWWSPDKSFMNILFNIIHSAGTDGLTTSDLRKSAAGEFFARPIEILLTKYTEDWDVSQPPHLRHLTVVRDSASIGRAQHLLYLTIEKFEYLVQQGLSSWHAIRRKSDSKGGPAQSQKNAKKMHIAHSLNKIDQYGFAEIQGTLLGARHGQGTLSQNSNSTVMDYIGVTGNDPVAYQENDEWKVRYPPAHGNKKVRNDSISVTKSVRATEVPTRPRGRPRKYAKGEELYKMEVRERLVNEGRLPPSALELSKSGKRKRPLDPNDNESSHAVYRPLPYEMRDSRLSLLPQGAHIDPPGSAKPKLRSQGRPRKAKILVIKTTRLGELSLPLLPVFVAKQTTDPSLYSTELTAQDLSSNDVDEAMPDIVSNTDIPAANAKPHKTQSISGVGEVPNKTRITPEQQSNDPLASRRLTRKRKRQNSIPGHTEPVTDEAVPNTRSKKLRGHHLPVLGSDSSTTLSEALPEPSRGLNNQSAFSQTDPRLTNATVTSSLPATREEHQPSPMEQLKIATGQVQNYQQSSSESIMELPANTTDHSPEREILPDIEIQSHEQHNANTSSRGAPNSSRGGTIHFLRRKTMLDILDEHGGVFPGDRDLYIVWALRWKEVNSDNAMADTRTYKMVEKALTASRELKIFKFSFRTTKGQQLTRTILARAHISPTSPLVRDLENEMIQADCGSYIPPTLGVSDYHRRVTLNKQLPAVKMDVDEEVKVIRHHSLARERHREERSLRSELKRQFQLHNSNPSQADDELDDEERAEISRAWNQVFRHLRSGINGAKLSGSSHREYLERTWLIHHDSLDDFSEDISKKIMLETFQERPDPIQVEAFLALMVPRQQFYVQSGTFGTFPGLYHEHRLVPKSRQSASLGADSISELETRPTRVREAISTHPGYLDPLPTSLEEIMSRVLTFKGQRNYVYSPQHPLQDKLLQGIDMVEVWESKLYQPDKPKDESFSYQFINHDFPSTQVISVPEDSKDSGFVDFAAHGPSELYTPVFVQAVAVLQTQKLKSQRAKERMRKLAAKIRKTPSRGPSDPPRLTDFENSESPQLSPLIDGRVLRPARVSTQTPKSPQRRLPGLRSAEQSISSTQRGPRARLIQPTKLFKTRRLTARDEAEDTEVEVDGDVEAERSTKVFSGKGVPIAQMVKPRRRRGPVTAKDMTEDLVEKMITAVVVIRTLIGGLERNIDWVIVLKLFPDLSIDFVQRRWPVICQKNRARVELIQENFLDIFVEAYETNEIPSIDYDDLQSYDWEGLVKWAREHLRRTSPGVLDLPPTRQKLDASFTVEDETSNTTFWRDEYFNPLATQARRTRLASDHACAVPLNSSQESGIQKLELTTAMSWVRANIMTPLAFYDAEAAKTKLLTFSESQLDSALRQLVNDRIVRHVNKGREVPGRLYTLTDRFLDGLKRPIGENFFTSSFAYKTRLDAHFTSNGSSEYSYYARDIDVLVLLNLLSANRVTLVPRNPPNNKWGLTEGGYKTRSMDKTRLNFTMDIRPTPSYVYGNPFQVASAAASNAGDAFPSPPGWPSTVDNRTAPSPIPVPVPIPIWYDIHGNLIADVWKKTLIAVLFTMALRLSMDSREICRVSKPSLAVWEVDLVLEWGVAVGVVRAVGSGFGVGEYWWCCGV